MVEAELKADLNVLFGQLNLSKITTGLLVDYALEYTDLALFSGVISNENAVNMSVWLNIYKTVYSAKINNQINLTNPENVFLGIENAANAKSAVPLAMLHYRYDRFNDNAVQNGWLAYTKGQLWEVQNKPSPYEQRDVFAITPAKFIFESNTLAFEFDSNLFFRNNSLQISGLYMKFEETGAWVQANWNQPVTHTFAGDGKKTIQFKSVGRFRFWQLSALVLQRTGGLFSRRQSDRTRIDDGRRA